MKAIDILEKEWLKRIESVKQGITPDKTFQRSNLYYDFLFNCEKAGVKSVTFPYFKYNLIYKLEKKYGCSKEELNIFSKSDAVLYRRFGEELIKYEHVLYKCVGILATEKSGIAEVLNRYLAPRGIFCIDTQGIQSRYSMQIIERYIKMNYPAFTMSDYDISGCFMMKRYENIGAIRITLLEVMEKLGLNWDDVKQIDESPKNNHWDSIKENDKQILRQDGITYRVELDVIMKQVKPEDFCNVVLEIIDEHIPVKDMGEVMILPDYPTEIEELLNEIKRKFKRNYEGNRVDIKEDFNEIKKSFLDINLDDLESDAQDRMDGVDYTNDIRILTKLLKELS